MTALHIASADDDVTTGIALVPSSVPESWTGAASTSCQTQLDSLRTLLAGLDPLLDKAQVAMKRLDDAGYQCGVVG